MPPHVSTADWDAVLRQTRPQHNYTYKDYSDRRNIILQKAGTCAELCTKGQSGRPLSRHGEISDIFTDFVALLPTWSEYLCQCNVFTINVTAKCSKWLNKKKNPVKKIRCLQQPAKHWYGSKFLVSNEQFRNNIFPWHLINSPTFSWQLSNDLTFPGLPGFPAKWSSWPEVQTSNNVVKC